MPLYFAYGANMDVAAMALRCPGSKPLGLARLPRHRFIITRDGYASVVRDPRRVVYGVLWDASLSDIRTLDKFEAVNSGLYVKITQSVLVEGGSRRALIYVGCSGFIGKPRPGYLENVLASAQHWDFPAQQIAEMAAFLGRPMDSTTAPAVVAAQPAVQTRAERPMTDIGLAPRASDKWRWSDS